MCKACCGCCTDKCGKCTLIACSILILIISAIILGLAFYFYEFELFTESPQEEVQRVGDATFYIMIIFGALGIVTGILGLVTSFCQYCCCIGIYATLSFIVAIVYGAIGITLLIVGITGDKYITKFCDGEYDSITSGLNDMIQEIDYQMGDVTSSYMCTSIYCPCPTDLDLVLYNNETQNNYWNRTIYTTEDEYTYIYSGLSTESTYTNFYDCYETNKDLASYAGLSADVNQDYISILQWIEEEFECSGICQPGLFWFFADVTLGPPEDNCINGIRKDLEKYCVGIGATLLIGFFLTIIGFFAQYGLWSCNQIKKRKSRD